MINHVKRFNIVYQNHSTDTVIVKVEYQIVNNLDQGSLSTVLRAKARLSDVD